MNRRAADLIANRLANGLVVPASEDGKTLAKAVTVPGLSNLGMTPEQVVEFTDEAGLDNDATQLIGDAIVALLENEGNFTLIDRDELEALRAAVATPAEASPAAPNVEVLCQHTRKKLLEIPVARKQAMLDCDLLQARIADAHA